MATRRPAPYEIVEPTMLRKRLADAEWLEAPLTDGVSPLTVVDAADRADTDRPVTVPTTTPRVFVAVCGTGSTIGAACDVAVDAGNDGDVALAEIAATCSTAPRAASVAAQLLRTASDGTVSDALWRESITYSMLLAGPEFAAWRDDYSQRHNGSAGTGTDGSPVVVEDHGDRFDIVLDRPQKHNAYNAAMRDALVEVLRALAALDPPPALRLRGSGPSFCSGGDLDEFGTTPDVVLAHGVRTNRAPGLLLAGLGPFTSASVHGACIGAGTELPAFCARVEATPDAFFQLPEVAMGLIPGAGGTVSVTRRIGRQRTALLALTGRAIDAPTALEWGLIDAVVPSG